MDMPNDAQTPRILAHMRAPINSLGNRAVNPRGGRFPPAIEIGSPIDTLFGMFSSSLWSILWIVEMLLRWRAESA